MRVTGIGPVLREARLSRGKSIEEASRETRIREEYLLALEREDFQTFLGDVYVRGFLRTYAGYLGLDADSVLAAYNRTFGDPEPMLPGPLPGPVRGPRVLNPRLFPLRRHHPTWAFLALAAVLVIALLAVAGLLKSGQTQAPAAAVPPPSLPVSLSPSTAAQVVVGVVAHADVHARVVADGRVTFDGMLLAGQGRSFTGARSVEIELARGGVVALTVNGTALGTPGRASVPYIRTYGPNDYVNRATPTPPPGGSPSPAASSQGGSPSPSATASA